MQSSPPGENPSETPEGAGAPISFDTKIAIVVRSDLATWQRLNVTAFLMSGLVGATPSVIGERYVDEMGNAYLGLSVQPVIVLEAAAGVMAAMHRRALERQVLHALFIEEMFATGHDEANRAAFRQFRPETAKVVGFAVRSGRAVVDKITKGARMHP